MDADWTALLVLSAGASTIIGTGFLVRWATLEGERTAIGCGALVFLGVAVGLIGLIALVIGGSF